MNDCIGGNLKNLGDLEAERLGGLETRPKIKAKRRSLLSRVRINPLKFRWSNFDEIGHFLTSFLRVKIRSEPPPGRQSERSALPMASSTSAQALRAHAALLVEQAQRLEQDEEKGEVWTVAVAETVLWPLDFDGIFPGPFPQ